MNKENKVTNSHSDVTTLPDGTKLKIIVENYENSLFDLEKVYCKMSVEYVKSRGTRYVEFCKDPVSDEDMKKYVSTVIATLKKDPNKYKSQFASK